MKEHIEKRIMTKFLPVVQNNFFLENFLSVVLVQKRIMDKQKLASTFPAFSEIKVILVL
jgi:hypothetical protein